VSGGRLHETLRNIGVSKQKSSNRQRLRRLQRLIFLAKENATSSSCRPV
jgi:hypothetical protein